MSMYLGICNDILPGHLVNAWITKDGNHTTYQEGPLPELFSRAQFLPEISFLRLEVRVI